VCDEPTSAVFLGLCEGSGKIRYQAYQTKSSCQIAVASLVWWRSSIM